MKNKIFILIMFLFIFPICAFASGNVSVSTSNISIYNGNSTSFNITASNAAGKVTISSSNPSIATVNKSSEWVENGSLSVAVTGKSVGNTTITVVVDAATFDVEAIKKTYTINVSVKQWEVDKRDTDNTLSSLSIDNATINFDKSTLSYSVIVDNNIDNITINANPTSSKASVTGTGKYNLSIYNNSFDVKVVAENQTTKVYHIDVIRKDKDGNTKELSSDNYIRELSIEGVSLDFNMYNKNYSFKVDNSIEKLNINVSLNNEFAKYDISSTNLNEGSNIITITVTSENNSVTKYILNVYRKSNIPSVDFNSINELFDISSNEVIVECSSNNENILNKELLAKLKESNKIVTFNVFDENNTLLYSWKIDTKNIDAASDLNLKIEFNGEFENMIGEQTNYSKNKYLHFIYSGNLPENTNVTIYVGDEYKDGDELNLLYFNEKNNKLENDLTGLKVEKGYVSFGLKHCSTYILTQSNINGVSTNNSLLIVIVSILEFLIIAALVYYVLRLKKVF